MNADPARDAAERLANSYRDDAPPEAHNVMDPMIDALAGHLGESPEAWRGAELMMRMIGVMVHGIAEDDDTDADDVLTVMGTFASAFLDTPPMRASRRNGD